MEREPEQWSLAQRDLDARTLKAWEGLFTLGGPGLHLRGSLEEPLASAPQGEEYKRLPANVTSEVMRHPVSKWGTYVPGIYGRHPVLGLELINLPWFLWLVPIVEGERLDMERCEILAHERRLNLRDATLTRSLRWRTRGGQVVEIEHERFVSASEAGTCIQTLTLRADSPCEVIVESGIDADVRTNGFDHVAQIDFDEEEGALRCSLRTDRGEVIQVVSQVECGAGVMERVCREGRRAMQSLHAGMNGDRPLVIVKRSRIGIVRPAVEAGRTNTGRTVSAATLRPVPQVQRTPVPLPERFDLRSCRAAHISAWRSRWEECDIEIEGDPESQLALRTAVFHLLRAHPGEGSALAIDAKGYAGEAYWGRFFWDTEIYLLPFYLHTNPRLARALVEFRVRGLPAARENARARGYEGAKYPWESGPDGTEECPNPIYPEQELHITADVIYAMAHYFAATDDRAFLAREDVQRVLIETSRYWMSRIDWLEGRPHLLAVMGPDEYTAHSNDNAFTNAMVSFALRFAADHAGSASAAERQSWRNAAHLPILRHPDDPSLILQCAEFDELESFDFNREWRDRSRTLAAQVPLERLYRAKVLKQADVILLMLLLGNAFSPREKQRAWEYYLPLTTHDSSLSPATHALFAAQLGLRHGAWSFWKRASALDLEVEQGGAAEGIHIANCGMLWQTAIHGFAGISSAMHGETLTIEPRLPKHWRALRFPLAWRGRRLQIQVTQEQVAVRNLDPEASESVIVNGAARVIRPDNCATWIIRP